VTQVLFILLLAASVAFFARTMWLFGRALATGVADFVLAIDEIAPALQRLLTPSHD